MVKKGYTPEQIINKLREAEILLNQGATIATEEEQIIIRWFQGVPFDRQKLEPVLKDGITVGRTRIVISYRRLGKEWRKVLEGVLNRLSGKS